MSLDAKINALSKLARLDDVSALKTIQSELGKVKKRLEAENRFDLLEQSIKILAAFAFRLPKESTKLISVFLVRILLIELTHREGEGYSLDYIENFETREKLGILAVEMLEHIRYFAFEEILEAMLVASRHSLGPVAERAKECLCKMAELNISIIYADEDTGHKGWGFRPQKQVVNILEALADEARRAHFSAIIAICEKLLSPKTETQSSDWQTFTWTHGSIPADKTLIKVRQGALNLLESLYPLADSDIEISQIISAMNVATSTHHQGELPEGVRKLIDENSCQVLEFYLKCCENSELMILQKIEEKACHIYRTAASDEVRDRAVKVRERLSKNSEYQIFKYLIGFRFALVDWGQDDTAARFHKADEERTQRIQEFVETINDKSFVDWQSRILKYAEIQSSDGATFGHFRMFLERLGELKPKYALNLLDENREPLKRFLAAIIVGVLRSDENTAIRTRMSQWIDEGVNLAQVALALEYSPKAEVKLMPALFKKARKGKNTEALIRLLSAVFAKFEEIGERAASNFVKSAISTLTELKDSRWINEFWFRENRNQILKALGEDGLEIILQNMQSVNKIDYHAEEVLAFVAECSPELVLAFFKGRIDKEERQGRQLDFQSVPFGFQKLNENMATHTRLVVKEIRSWFDTEDYLFEYRGGQLLQNIFPEFTVELEDQLRLMVQDRKEADLKFIISFLRAYDGQEFIFNICREIVRVLPEESDLLKEVTVPMRATGVVSGYYGFAEEYDAKVKILTAWLEDEEENVRDFAKSLIDDLKERADGERKRADEDIALRKYKYGERNTEESEAREEE